ncbi:VirB4 family type IV secretion system protein [Claveliimonas monacensis]|uniref:VirB4 family type IV secretion system protein n=1 Tax=Claveliimonas monacensis TaxID=2779351 RepID=UPI001CF8C65F|nr:hypothetical protein [Claveliimonas monacensis]
MEISQEIKELEARLREARREERQMQKEERLHRQRQKKVEREQSREESRTRREIQIEEEKLRRCLANPQLEKSKPDSNQKKKHSVKSKVKDEEQDLLPMTWAATYLPIRKIKNGIIYTNDGRYVKILEILPINFLLRSPSEQRNIVFSFLSYLKIAPVRMQFKIVSKKADIAEYLEKIQEEIEHEEDEQCRILQEDYARLIRSIGTKEAITRRFFLIFEYHSYDGNRNPKEKDVYLNIRSAVQTAKKYLAMCGNVVLEHENESRFCVDVLYQILNRRTSVTVPLSERIRQVSEWYRKENGRESLSRLPVTELFAPNAIDFRHRNYVVFDGVYHTYLYIPSNKYRIRVPAGWLSLLINAGEGIDVDVFFFKQDKAKCVERIGRRIRLNRSKLKETYDTNTDYDDLSESIRAGFYLKNGLSGSEEFYYMATLITVTGHSEKEVEWRAREMAKLLSSQDIGTARCIFSEEAAFLSSLPILNLDQNLYRKSRRNVLTSGVAACYPFVSYEMSDRDGILMGVNKANNSLVIVDIFNSEIYKNANITILGTSGAGKTFCLQLMALRMRRKNIQVFIVAPEKGHELARACQNIGGAYLKIAPGSDYGINIMEIRPSDQSARVILDGEASQRSELAMKIQSLHIFFTILIPDITHEERQLLDEAFILTYKEKGITHDNESLWDENNPGKYKEMPVLGDLYRILMEKEDTIRMANILNRLVNGSSSNFNRRTNIDLDNKYIVLDISEMQSDLGLATFTALDFVWSKVKEDRTKEKAFFIDECWALLADNELTANYILEIFKTIRGYGGAAVCASQDLEDFFSLKNGKYGKGVLNNSKTKIILNLEHKEAEIVKNEMDLSEAEALAITRFERGNALISTNSNNLLVEFKASQLEKDLITTDRKDLKELKERLEKYGGQAYGRKGA